MADTLKDWAPEEFSAYVFSKHPAPLHPETGEAVWEKGIRLHGAQQAIINSPYRFQQARGGIRAGKSFVAAAKVYIDVLWMCGELGRRGMLWWVVGPDYEQTYEEMRHLHRLLDEAGIPHSFRQPPNASWSITFPHWPDVEVVTKTSKDEVKIAGRPPRGIVMAEAAQQTEEAWFACRMRVSQSRGWVLIEGTFEGSAAWFYGLAEEWTKAGAMGVSYALPSWSNPVLYPLGADDPELLALKNQLPPAKFLEKFGGEPQKPSNLKMPQADARFHIAHRYRSLRTSFDPEQPVYLAIDPGAAHAYAVLVVQCWENVSWVVDAVYRWGRDAAQMVDECTSRPWAPNVESAVIDIAGEQKSSTGPPNAEQWQSRWVEKTGRQLYIHAQRVPLDVGYEVHQRALLNSWPEDEARRIFDPDRKLRGNVTDPEGPRLMFDPAAAAPLFGGMVDNQSYRGEYNLHRNPRRRDGTIPRDVPIDEDNDAIKALNYFLFWLYGPRLQTRWIYSAGTTVPWEVSLSG